MNHISNHVPAFTGGGRISSPAHREMMELCDDFTGLEENTQRYDLLLLVKRAGKLIGFTPRMVELLDYYMAYTRDIDWQAGARPIIYQSLAKTALDLGVSERHIQRIEQKLFEVGAITWNDSGNHRRYGHRDPHSGKIVYAYGVDLTPLAYLKGELCERLEEKKLYDHAWLETKRKISWYRRQMRAHLAELEQKAVGQGALIVDFQQRYNQLAVPIRTYMKLDQLRDLQKSHANLCDHIVKETNSANKEQKHQNNIKNEAKETQIESCTGDKRVVHYKSTNQKQSNKLDTSRPSANNFQKSCNEISGPYDESLMPIETGIEHISLKQVLNAASENFKAYIPMHNRALDWRDIVEAADKIRKELFISHEFWAMACQVLGRNGAAICILLTEQAVRREDDPVKRPPAYFRAMVNRAKTGELHLHQSIFGLLKRDEAQENEVKGDHFYDRQSS